MKLWVYKRCSESFTIRTWRAYLEQNKTYDNDVNICNEWYKIHPHSPRLLFGLPYWGLNKMVAILQAIFWNAFSWQKIHYDDVIMGAMASQITSLTNVYSTVYSGADQRKHQSSVSLACVGGIQRGPVNSPHKWPVTRKMFPFDDVIMCALWFQFHWRANRQ